MATSDDLNLDATEKRPAIPVHKEGFTIDDYRLIVRIGEGSFGEVWKAERGGYPVALKILNASITTEEAQRELKSLETLKQLHHRFLVHTENFWSDGDRLYIEMELADGGTLKERLKAYQALGKPGIPGEELLKYFTESAQALDYLHGHRPVFLHRDIKPANILLVQSCAKLADFGLLRQVTGDNTSTKTQGGTPVYMAPESVKEDKFSIASDLWSFAVTYAELRQGRLPFSAKTQFQIFQKVCQDPPELDDLFHPDEKKVLLRALEKDPKERFSSCGDFVFELNRVVPWTAAEVVPALPMPPQVERKPGSTRPKGSLPSAATPADPGTQRKRPVPTMEEMTLPPTDSHQPNAPTIPSDDGTVVNEKLRRSDKPNRTEAQPDQGQTVAPTTPSQGTKANPFAVEKKPTATHVPPRPPGKRNVLPRIVVLAVVVAVIAGVGFLVVQRLQNPKDNPPNLGGLSSEAVAAAVDKALRDDDFEKARATVEQNRKSLPDSGEKLLARIEQKANALDLLQSADALLKKKDFEGAIALLKNSKTTLEFSADSDRKADILTSARDAQNLRLVAAMRDAIKSRKADQIRQSFQNLSKFRDENPRPDWMPKFQELPPPTDLQTKAWDSLLSDKVVVAEARRRLEELREYANPQDPDKFVLDTSYESNLLVLEALIKAHESNAQSWETESKELANAATLATTAPLSQNFWGALTSFEKGNKRFRFKDLDLLTAAPIDEPAKQPRSDFFAIVLARLAQQDNYQWYPSDSEIKKCRAWLTDFKGPGDIALAFKAEALIRTSASEPEFAQLDFSARHDWYTGYVHALVLEKTKGVSAAADTLATLLKGNATARKERMKEASRVFRAAVASVAPKGPAPRQFASKDDAAKAFTWLTALLDLENTPPLNDFLDMTAAAIQAGHAEADARLEALPGDIDKLQAADRQQGYRLVAKMLRDELESARLRKEVSPRTLHKCEKAQEFAYRMGKEDLLLEAAQLNCQAIVSVAQITFAKSKDAHASFQVFEAALRKARVDKSQTKSDGFVLPLVVATLESAKDFARADMEAAINEGEKALTWKLPDQKEWQSLHGRTMVRLADLKYNLLFKKVEAKEKIEPRIEYPIILGLYQKARSQYVEKFAGELIFKIGRLHVLLEEFQKAYNELKVAREKLAAIRQPYPEEDRAEISEALRLTEGLLNTPELKAFAK